MKPTLIEQIGVKNKPLPMLLGEESFLERKDKPLLQVLTYREIFNPEKSRETALNILENESLKERGIVYKGHPWKFDEFNNPEKLKKNLDYSQKEFDFLSVSGTYIPWKGPWEKGRIVDNLEKKYWAYYGYFVGGASILSLASGSPFLGVGSASLLVFALVEKNRRNKKEIVRIKLNKLENAADSYNTIQDNLERAEIEVYSPDSAKKIFGKVKEIRKRKNNPYELKSINLKKVNKDLINSYDNFLRANP